ncbi:hypothetical protein X943_002250 [Babesia divergens]|uniref:Uncharacterized protein n=1 Tax=Babesia divergens TaxID=32595 RepID=A0AAD9GJR1_BABDI|nr:hypothetical protein X943_002250 [Babesia divergens]
MDLGCIPDVLCIRTIFGFIYCALEMKLFSRDVPSFVHRPCQPMYTALQRDSLNILNNGDSLVSTVGAWKCVLRMFTLRSKSPEKIVQSWMFELIDKNETVETLRSDYERHRSLLPDFEKHKAIYVKDLFASIKSAGTLPLHKTALLKDLLAGMETDIVKKALYESLNTCKNKAEANLLLLIYDVVLNEGKHNEIPPIASIYEIYGRDNIDPLDAISSYKCHIYKEEVERILSAQMEHLSKTNPPVPPPITGSASEVKDRKKELVDLLGGEKAPIVKRSEGNIEVASRTMLKPAWLVQFYNDAKNKEPPSCGWSLLMMSKDECQRIYKDVINERVEQVKEQVLRPKEVVTNDNLKEMPKLAMLTYCRKYQLAHVCKNVSDWARIEGDRVERLKNLYSIDIRNEIMPYIPIHRHLIGGGKALPQPFYVNPDDDPNYDPPGSTASSRLMRKLIRGDEDDGDKYVLTDLETRKKGLAVVAKDLEPFEHLPQEELTELVLRNCKKEYELAEAICRRRSRGRQIEDDDEKAMHHIHNDADTSMKCDANGSSGLSGNVKDSDPCNIPKGYVVSCNKLLTDVVVFLSTLEHLQWQFASAIDLPMESLVHVHNAGDSTTNPKPPVLHFTGWRFHEAFGFAQSYIGAKNKANRYRIQLHESVERTTINDAKNKVNNLLLFGDDPLFYLKDQEMLQQMVGTGVGLEIHSKVPGLTLPPDPTEHQKSMVFYRMSISQPHPQLICAYCGYTVFSHSIKAHDGEVLHSTEYEEIGHTYGSPCPVCNIGGNFTQSWTTGSRGYTEEPYPRPVEDEFCDD